MSQKRRLLAGCDNADRIDLGATGDGRTGLGHSHRYCLRRRWIRRPLDSALVLALVFIGLQWTYLVTSNRLFFGSGVVVLLLFMSSAMADFFAYLRRRGPVTADKLHAALAIYILAA